MRVWGVCVLRDEEDIIRFTLSHLMAQGLDGLVLLDHGSTDGTRAQIDAIMAGQVECHLFTDADRPFRQGVQLTELARIAAGKGADWIVPFDADELWYSCGKYDLADTIRHFSDGAVIRIPLWDHLPTTRDPASENPFLRYPYRRKELFSVGKIVCRADSHHVISDGAHIVVDNRTTLMPRGANGDIGIRHFPVRGFDHFLRKTRKMAEGLEQSGLPEGVGIQWRSFGRLEDDALKAIYYSRYYTPDPEDNGMVYDPAPYKGDM